MPVLNICIPDDIDFADLKLTRDPVDGDLSFDWDPIEKICAATGIDVATFRDSHEDNVAGLLVAWYVEHRRRGGAPDPVEEQILAEVNAEDALGEYRVQRGPGKGQ